MARWGLARGGAQADAGPGAEQEALAALDRLTSSVWRENDTERSHRMADRAPRALREVRRDLRRLRRIGLRIDLIELILCAQDALHEIAEVVEPSWPALGGPWWTSAVTGRCFDVADPADETGRHGVALADVFLELDEHAVLDPFGDEETVPKHGAHVLGLADCALGHAVASGLAGGPV